MISDFLLTATAQQLAACANLPAWLAAGGGRLAPAHPGLAGLLLLGVRGLPPHRGVGSGWVGDGPDATCRWQSQLWKAKEGLARAAISGGVCRRAGSNANRQWAA